MKPRILIVDDDPAVSRVLGALLHQAGWKVDAAPSAEAALGQLESELYEVVISDLRMPGMGGMKLVEVIAERWPDIPVVVLTAHGNVSTAVEAMKHGAADFIQKPFERDEILFVVDKAAASVSQERPPAHRAGPGNFVGESEVMTAVYELIAKAAASKATVLVRGETGTGKELIARALHEQSPRAKGPFVKIHCAALPDNLLESELFGHEKGAFTGAIARKPGRIELAQKGTLFLDEIGDITPALQVKLLRLLQDKAFERVGGTQTLTIDTRFVAATHRPLEQMVAEGTFREDLFFRLNIIPIWSPPLRDRPGDIGHLARHFCDRFGEENGRPDCELTAGAVKRLQSERWPGNVRQLENFIERLIVLADSPQLDRAAVELELARNFPVPTLVPDAPAAASLDDRVRSAEIDAIRDALQRCGNNRTQAARLLGVSRRTLYYKLEQYGLIGG